MPRKEGWGNEGKRKVKKECTVEFRSNGPASNRNPPITETILMSLEKFSFIFYIGNNRNPLITDNPLST